MKILCHWLFISVLITSVTTTSALENTTQCEGTTVVVNYNDIDDFKLVCGSVNDVVKLAKQMGINEALPVSISIVDKLTITHTGTALALFKPDTMIVQVLSQEICKSSPNDELMFGQKIDEELYRSMIIHELAHVLAWQNKKAKTINRGLFEYFAYVVQFILLDDTHRQNIIASTNVGAFTDDSEITDMYYFLGPDKFAIKSYLHFIKLEDGWSYLSAILEK